MEELKTEFKLRLQHLYVELLEENGLSTGDIDPLMASELEDAENKLANVVTRWMQVGKGEN